MSRGSRGFCGSGHDPRQGGAKPLGAYMGNRSCSVAVLSQRLCWLGDAQLFQSGSVPEKCQNVTYFFFCFLLLVKHLAASISSVSLNHC